MRPTTYIIMALAATLLAACTTDDDYSNPTSGKPLRLEVPISVVAPQLGSATRFGDPGIDTECPPPTDLYVLTWVQVSAATYEFEYIHRRNITTSAWTLLDKTSEHDARYELNSTIALDMTTPGTGIFGYNQQIGRTYVFATRKALTDAQVVAMIHSLDGGDTVFDSFTGDNFGGGNEAKYKADNISAAVGAAIDGRLQTISMNCVGWNSAELRDLYSTPVAHDGKHDDRNITNGLILYNDVDYAAESISVLHGDVRLYHVAAKYDFKWEVAMALQSTTAVERITVSGLPTECLLFSPATNSASAPTNSYVIGGAAAEAAAPKINNGVAQPINAGNKWIGREHFYALQTASGSVVYTVDFEDVDGAAPGVRRASVNQTFTPYDKNDIFTGWYRINATVN